MLFGTKKATLDNSEIYEIHGQKMCLLRFFLEESPAVPMEARLAPESIYHNPHNGDSIEISFAAGLAIEVKIVS